MYSGRLYYITHLITLITNMKSTLNVATGYHSPKTLDPWLCVIAFRRFCPVIKFYFYYTYYRKNMQGVFCVFCNYLYSASSSFLSIYASSINFSNSNALRKFFSFCSSTQSTLPCQVLCCPSLIFMINVSSFLFLL